MATCVWCRCSIKLLAILSLLVAVYSVDRNNFKTCDQSGFCKRNRNMQAGESPYYLQMNSFKIKPTKIEGQLINSKNGVALKLELTAQADAIIRMKVSEYSPLRPRFEPKDALLEEPKEINLQVVSKNSESLVVKFGPNKAVLTASPFRLDVYSKDQLVIVANARGLMRFEHFRPKDQPKPAAQGGEEDANENQQQAPPEDNEENLWEESFKGKTDSKIYGPSSVGMDFSFIGAEHVYGIPEHADKFALKQTKGSTDPYRLYNLDVFEYELENPMALYGSIPLMLAHSETNTVGLLWFNAAETWVDVESSSNQGVVSSIVDFVKGHTKNLQQDTHWFSESGNIDVFFMLGPGPKDVMKQYASLTGTTPLPPLFSIAYHQCRWNYKDQDDVRNVDAGFDQHDIPYDVIWLDVDHTDDRKYFTWDPYKFPTPKDMLNNITSKGRKMVTLIDPHIKKDSSYYIHKEATDKGYYVKNKDGADYEGWCWPGTSGYLDFLSPEIRDWWSSKYDLDQYKGSTLSLYTWNDMNEPSVFNEPEMTMPKDVRHFGGWEHREIHNIYGMLMVMASYKGHLMRSEGKQRPFILTRSFFIGSQRFGAVWTGDNMAEWGHLRISIPMALTSSITGMSFVGADVGGFFKSPSSELALRWFQAGAFQPFYRSHSHHETKRREPWLFEEEVKTLIRESLRKRYSFLPFWYTLFYETEKHGIPPMRPMWMEFPTDKTTFSMDEQYMIGDALLVRPVLESGATGVDVYFPGENQIWYDIDTHQKYEGPQKVRIPVTLSKIPVYQRGGTIIPKKERIRRSSTLTYNDPYTLVVALDVHGKQASGSLYIDDFDNFEYRKGNYLLLNFTYEKNILSSKLLEGPGNFETKAWLERVVIVGLSSSPKTVQISSRSLGTKELLSTYDVQTQVLIVRKPSVKIGEEWKIILKQ